MCLRHQELVQGERFLHCHLLHPPHSRCCSSPPIFTSPFHTHPIPPSPAPSAGGGEGCPASFAPGCGCVAHITTTGSLGSHTHMSTQDKRRTDRWEKRGGKKGEIKMRDKRHVKKKKKQGRERERERASTGASVPSPQRVALRP